MPSLCPAGDRTQSTMDTVLFTFSYFRTGCVSFSCWLPGARYVSGISFLFWIQTYPMYLLLFFLERIKLIGYSPRAESWVVTKNTVCDSSPHSRAHNYSLCFISGGWGSMLAPEHVWRSEDNAAGPRDWTGAARLGRKHLYLLRHLVSLSCTHLYF